VMLEAVKLNGGALEYVYEGLKGDKELVLAAINQDGSVFQYASKKLKEDREVVLAAVRNWFELRLVSEEMKGDKEVVLMAVNYNGNLLRDASEELKGNKEVVLAAVNKHGCALRYSSEDMKGNEEVVLAAINQDGSALQYALPAFRDGGLRTCVVGLLNVHTVPTSVFLGTVLCGTKFPSARALGADDGISSPVEKEATGKDGGRFCTESSRACLLPKLDLGDVTTVVLMKKIAAFAGVQCQEFCGVPWSHVVKAARLWETKNFLGR